MEFIWNSEYIAQHTLDNHIITDSGIKLLNDDEIFVEHDSTTSLAAVYDIYPL